jgi:hypothetical protein
MANRVSLGSALVLLLVCDLEAAVRERPLPEVSRVLTIGVSSDCDITAAALTTARDEASDVWGRARVALRWVPASQVPYGSPRSEWMLITCIAGDPPAVRRRGRAGLLSIAAIRFVDAMPLNTMMVSLGNARQLLQQDGSESREMDRRFGKHREKRFGRILGRAIAHEIGHFLAKSTGHTATGLMRASHSVAALTGESLAAFRVDHRDLAELVAASRLRESVDPIL